MISIQISVDERLARKVRPVAAIFTTWRVLAVIAMVALLLPLSLGARPVEDDELTTFESGQSASASAVNRNFVALQTAVNDNNARLVALEGKNLLPSAQGIHAYAVIKLNGEISGDSAYTGIGESIVSKRQSKGRYYVTFENINCVTGPGTYQGIVNVSVYPRTPPKDSLCGLTTLQQDIANIANCKATIQCKDRSSGASQDTAFAVEYIR